MQENEKRGDRILNYLRLVCTVLILFCFSVGLIANETATKYFPTSEGSFWVYEDQDGNEFKRTSIKKVIVGDEIYHAFEYEPTIDDWGKYNYLLQPYLYQVGEEWITFFVADEIENAVKSTLSKRLDEIDAELRQKYTEQLPSGITIDFNRTIKPTAQDVLYLFPISINSKQNWMVTQVSVKVDISMDIKGAQINIPNENKLFSMTMNVSETGKFLERESVETDSETYENCLKIEFRTKTSSTTNATSENKQLLPTQTPKDKITTLWLAPNVGIVKLESTKENSKEVNTVVLKRYEIKTAESEPVNE